MAKEKQVQEVDCSEAKAISDINLSPRGLMGEKRSRRANFLFKPTVYAALEVAARLEGVSCNAFVENSLLDVLRAMQRQERKEQKGE